MIDRLGRNITYLRISVTDKCNLRCRYCMPEAGVCKKDHADMMTEDEFITAVEAAASLGITKLRMDVRAKSVCPLTDYGIKALDPEFKQAARKAYDLLLEDEACAAYLRELDEAFSL